MELVAPKLTDAVAWLAMIAGTVFAIWWTIGLFAIHSREKEAELPEVEAPDGIKEKFTGVPPVLTIFFIFMGITLVAYILSVWLTRVTY